MSIEKHKNSLEINVKCLITAQPLPDVAMGRTGCDADRWIPCVGDL